MNAESLELKGIAVSIQALTREVQELTAEIKKIVRLMGENLKQK
jgi:hypothetical protein